MHSSQAHRYGCFGSRRMRHREALQAGVLVALRLSKCGLFCLASAHWLAIVLCSSLEGVDIGRAIDAGRIESAAEWTGEVHVLGPVVVDKQSVLTLRPPVRLVFSRGAGLRVEGQIVGEGTPESPVVLVGADGVARGEWLGVEIVPVNVDVPGSRLTGCVIEGAAHGVALKRDGSSPHRVASCTIKSCRGSGVWLDGVTGAIIEDNQVTDCGRSGEAPAGGIWCERSRDASVVGNRIVAGARYGILVRSGELHTLRRNHIHGIGGKAMSTEGMGICVEHDARRILVQSNEVKGCNYCGIAVYGPDNLVIDNDVGDSPDGIGLAGAPCTGNIVRDNRITRGWWSTLYVTSQARDNLLVNNVVHGGDGGITTRAAGPNLWENCTFYNHNSQGSLVLMGTGIATFRRCAIRTNGMYDLQLEYGSYARVIDSKIRKDRIAFGEGTGEHNFIEWLHTARVTVVDDATGQGVSGAKVEFASQIDPDVRVAQATMGSGEASLEVLETTVRKDGLHDATPHRVTVSSEGYRPAVLDSVEVRDRVELHVRLRKRE